MVGEEIWLAKMDYQSKGFCDCDEKHDPTWQEDGQNFIKCPGIMKRRYPSTTPADEIILRDTAVRLTI